ncbi:MAG: GtrA family protein [Oscillospiraceae bacterium]|nr:GtrA family protein [Oscillospiraceae bacterium]
MNRKKEFIRVIKFAFFSASAAIIQILSFTLFNEVFRWNYWACYLPSLLLSIVWCFTMNRNFTFKSANNIPIAMAKMLLFYAVFTPLTTLGGNYLVEKLLWNEYLVTAMNMILNFVLEFLYQRFFVFGKSIDTKK